MSIVQCKNHHYYDDSRDAHCPYCKKLELSNNLNSELDEQPTMFKVGNDFQPDDDFTPTEAYGEFVDKDDKTLGIFSVRQGNLLTAGWLVCIEGIVKGQSFTFYSGRNFAGRSENMDIVIREDNEVTRDSHFSLVFDPKSVRYFIVEGNGATYVNGKIVVGQQELVENDVIEIGKSKLCFVPFCKEGRIWK
jgi:hypothetical protein